MVLVVKINKLAQPQMSGKRRGFLCDAFHQVAVSTDGVRVVINDGVPRTVISCCEPRFGNRHSNTITETLAERAGRHLDTNGVSAFRVARRFTTPFTKAL